MKNLFGKNRKVANLDYNEAVEALAEDGDESAKEARKTAYSAAAPAIAKAADVAIRPHTRQP